MCQKKAIDLLITAATYLISKYYRTSERDNRLSSKIMNLSKIRVEQNKNYLKQMIAKIEEEIKELEEFKDKDF